MKLISDNSHKVAYFRKILFEEKSLLFVFLSCLLGIIIGSFIYNISDVSFKNDLLCIFEEYYISFKSLKFSEAFIAYAKRGVVFFISLFFLGSSVFGKYIVLPLIFYKTIGIGTLVSLFYNEYSLKGLGYTLLIFVPGKIIYFFAMLVMVRYCYDYSDRILNNYINTKTPKESTQLFALRCIILLLVFLLSCFIDSVCCYLFNSLFNFME